MIKNPWKTIKSRVAYKNPWMTVRHDDVIRPDGKKGIYGVVVKRDFVLVIPVYQKKLYLVNIYRYPVQAESWEFPEGDWEPNETHRAGAQRELLEETGFCPGQLVHLANLWLAVGNSNQGFNVYLADDCRKVSEVTDLDIAKVRGFTVNQLEKMIQQGKIKDSPTVTALYLYQKYLRR
jgi:8-oxo-dGTP pyrophosphatase MutT (NUDIX family)